MKLSWKERWRLLWRGELPPPPPTLPATQPPLRLRGHNATTLSSWFTPDRIAWARETFSTPAGRDMLGVLSNLEPPRRLDSYAITDSSVQTHILYGMHLGMAYMRGVIEMLGHAPQAPASEIEADYGASDTDLS